MARRIVRGAAIFAVLILFTLPLLYMVTGSLREPGGPPPRGLLQLEWPLTFSNFSTALDLADLGRMAINSTGVAAVTAGVSVLSASWAGFAIARAKPAARRRWVGLLLVMLMVPAFALWVPRFFLFTRLGMVDTYVPLVAIGLIGVSPFNVLLCVWSFRRVPDDLWDAAEAEGASPIVSWWRVGLPLVRGTIVAVGVLSFAASWGGLIEPLLYISDARRYTLPLGLRALQQLGPTGWPLMLAGACIATLPVVVVFALVQRRLVSAHRGAGWLGH